MTVEKQREPDPLGRAQELFEAGSAGAAADVLRQVREVARIRGRFDVVAEIDDAVDQMRGRLNGLEREAFDQVLERGQPVASVLRPLATRLLDPATLVLSLVPVITLVAAWIVAGSEGCGSELPDSAILLVLSTGSAGAVGLSLGLHRGERTPRRILIGILAGAAIAGIWFLVGGFVWGAISFGHCPIGPFVEF